MVLKSALTGIALTMFLMAGAASAATLSIDGGTAGNIPGAKAKNDALQVLFGVNTLAGYFNSAIQLIGPAKVTFTFHGAEASWGNKFFTDNGSFSNGTLPDKNEFSVTGFGSFMEIMGAGLAKFAFFTNGGSQGPDVTNANGDNAGNDVTFFASMVGGGTTGNSLYLFFDDGGAGPNDNHDDMVVRMDVAPIPLPAAGFMLLAGLGGLAAAKRRRKAV